MRILALESQDELNLSVKVRKLMEELLLALLSIQSYLHAWKRLCFYDYSFKTIVACDRRFPCSMTLCLYLNFA